MIAFGMYSKIPMPKVEWKKENMKYTMCFFPWIGAVIGLLFYFWGIYGKNIPVGNTLYAVVLTILPILITGGIHLDGLLDTADALSSWQPKERRLEILKDSHTGAFAIITCVIYVLLYFGMASELSPQGVSAVAVGFVLSRCFSGYSVTAFPCAKDSGLAAVFANSADKKYAGKIIIIEGIAASVILLCVSIPLGLAVIGTGMLTVCWYYHMSVEKFGGITGDLAGCFLQVCELMMLTAVILVQKVG